MGALQLLVGAVLAVAGAVVAQAQDFGGRLVYPVQAGRGGVGAVLARPVLVDVIAEVYHDVGLGDCHGPVHVEETGLEVSARYHGQLHAAGLAASGQGFGFAYHRLGPGALVTEAVVIFLVGSEAGHVYHGRIVGGGGGQHRAAGHQRGKGGRFGYFPVQSGIAGFVVGVGVARPQDNAGGRGVEAGHTFPEAKVAGVLDIGVVGSVFTGGEQRGQQRDAAREQRRITNELPATDFVVFRHYESRVRYSAKVKTTCC